MCAVLVLASLLAQDALSWPKRQPPPPAPEPGTVRAAAVDFNTKLFDAKAARAWKAPVRRGFLLWNQERVFLVFDRPSVEGRAISWTGRVEGSRLPAGVTLVLNGAVVSAHFSLDDGRSFELKTLGSRVWLRETKAMEIRESAPRPPIE